MIWFLIGILFMIALFVSFGFGVKIGSEAAKEKIEEKLGDSLDEVLKRLRQ